MTTTILRERIPYKKESGHAFYAARIPSHAKGTGARLLITYNGFAQDKSGLFAHFLENQPECCALMDFYAGRVQSQNFVENRIFEPIPTRFRLPAVTSFVCPTPHTSTYPPREFELLGIEVGDQSVLPVARTERVLHETVKEFLPTSSLARDFLASSVATIEEYQRLYPALFDTMQRHLPGQSEPEVYEMREAIGELVTGVLETVAFRAASMGGCVVPISDSRGAFLAPVWEMLDNATTARPSDKDGLLRRLCSELITFAQNQPKLGKWGILNAAPSGLLLAITIQLPRPVVLRPAPEIIHNLQLD